MRRLSSDADAGLARSENAVRINGTLDLALQLALHGSIAFGNTVLESSVDAVARIALLLELINQFREAAVRALGFLGACAIEQQIHDVVHIAPTDDELSDIVKTPLVEDSLGQLGLFETLAAARLTHRREPHGAAPPRASCRDRTPADSVRQTSVRPGI